MTTDPIPHEKFANGMPAVDSKFIRISGRCIRYRRADLQAWIAERERHSTSQI